MGQQVDAVDDRIRAAGLRVTQGRRDVFAVLARAQAPVSHKEAVAALSHMDRVTVFRNLVALTEAGVAVRVDMGDHTWRYGLADQGHETHDQEHPHFACVSCGDVVCLEDVDVQAPAASRHLLDGAKITIQGTCDDCR